MSIPKTSAAILVHVANLEPAVAAAIVKEAAHTARLAREDGADTADGQRRLSRALGRPTTEAEQLALERCVNVHLSSDEPS